MITIFLLSIFNGLVISWQQNTSGLAAKWSKYWHLLGRVLILSIVLDCIFYWTIYQHIGFWAYCLSIFNLSWTIWNFMINLTRKLCGSDISLFHIGNGGFDGWIKENIGIKAVWIIGLALILINIGLLFY